MIIPVVTSVACAMGSGSPWAVWVRCCERVVSVNVQCPVPPAVVAKPKDTALVEYKYDATRTAGIPLLGETLTSKPTRSFGFGFPAFSKPRLQPHQNHPMFNQPIQAFGISLPIL